MMKTLNPPDTSNINLENPRIIFGQPMIVVGLSERHSLANPQTIPAQWQKFMSLYHKIPNKTDPAPLGVSTNLDDDGRFDYICAVQVSAAPEVPAGLIELKIPKQSYAVFVHRDHVSQISATYSAIWNDWLPNHKREPIEGPSLERHMKTFDPRTGLGGVEIWIPLKD